MAHGIVGLLDLETERAVRAMWEQLGRRFGLRQIHTIPYPHVSLLVFAAFEPTLVSALDTMSGSPAPPLRADGWMLFAGGDSTASAAVRTVSVSRSLLDLRTAVVVRCGPHVNGISPFMADGAWTPHITCAGRDLSARAAGEVFAWLAETNPAAWEGTVVALGLLVEEDGGHRLVRRVELGEPGN
ncbi:MAG: 2'-5' RNA ligase family protein [Acidimicrobiia bacterium]